MRISNQFAQHFSGRLRLHQSLANQKRAVSSKAQTSDICRILYTAFRNGKNVCRNTLGQTKWCLQIHLKCLEIAAVDSNKIAAGIQSSLAELLVVVDFAQYVESIFGSLSCERCPVRLWDNAATINRIAPVRSVSSCLQQLKFIDDGEITSSGKGSFRLSATPSVDSQEILGRTFVVRQY